MRYVVEEVYMVDTDEFKPNTRPLPRVFAIPKCDANEEIYEPLTEMAGEEVRLESDIIHGLFKVSIDNHDVVLTEVLRDNS